MAAESRFFYEHIAVPDIELGHFMGFYGVSKQGGEVVTSSLEGMLAFGEIHGFVVFIDSDSQPHSLRQYYTLNASSEFDENDNQIFYLTETLKMSHVSERKMKPKPFYVIRNDNREILLESEGGARIGLDKLTKSVVLDDGEAYLITSDSEFKDFMDSMFRG